MGRRNSWMKPSARIALVVLVVASVTIGIAWAANPHYKPRLAVTCGPASANVTGTSYNGSCSGGEASGLGNGDLTFGVIFDAQAQTFCHNKGNPSNIVPGQNPAEATGSNLTTVPGSAVKNGTFTFPPVTFNFSLANPTAEQAGCPNNNNWTVTLGSATWHASWVVYQPFPNLIQSLSFDF